MERTLLFYNIKELKDLMSLGAPFATPVRQPESWSAEINGNGRSRSHTNSDGRKERRALVMIHSLMVINMGSNPARAACSKGLPTRIRA